MHASVACSFLLSFIPSIFTITVRGDNASTVSKTTPFKLNDRAIVCNVVNSPTDEAVKSLERTLVETLEKKFEQLIAAVNKTAEAKKSFASCKDIYDNHKSEGNKPYLLLVSPQKKVPVYCHMASLGACGGGGWTLVMKIDGAKLTFRYNSQLWSNKVDFNLVGGKTGLDKQETKLPTYWSTHFSKICLGMRLGQQVRFIMIHKHANSLYSLIADGKYRATSLGRLLWKTLLGSQTSLQQHCNLEGFNVSPSANAQRARIGILGNNQKDCKTSDSRIGFGTDGYPDRSNVCGNVASHGGDNGDRRLKAMGYIFVQ